MKIEIKRWDNQEVIICGEYESIKDCVQNNRNVSFYRADLSYADLSYSDLHYSDLRSAKYSDLTIKKTPLQIANLKYDILIFTNHIKIGCELHKAKDWDKFTNKEIIAMDGQTALKFWKRYKTILIDMCRQHRLDK